MTTMKFARGTRALGICDRCGGTFKLHALKAETVRRKSLNNRVCPDCFDPDHPQNFVGENVPVDGQALRDPRPDTDPGR